MGDPLKGKSAIVTGAGRGIGRAIAMALAQEGASVVVNDFGVKRDGTKPTPGPADEVVQEIKSLGAKAVASYGDVASWQDSENLIKACVDNFGRLDILANMAGILRDRMIFNMTEEEWDALIAIHLKGHFTCTKFACAVLRKQRSGRIINTYSAAGLGNMGQANYSAAKEGIIGFTRTVARVMGRYGVTCNAIRPRAATRLTVTPELKAAWEKRAAEGLAGAGTGMALLPVFPPPEAVSPVVVFLCTDEATNINGRTFFISGGEVALTSEPENFRSIFKDGIWTVDELCELVPKTLAAGLVNPSPPQPAQT